jgi:hypothetical protein
MSHVVWAHFPEMQGNKELHFEIEGPVDLKNFTAVLHDNVQAVGGLRFVRVRNHAEREPAHVACISAHEHPICTVNTKQHFTAHRWGKRRQGVA